MFRLEKSAIAQLKELLILSIPIILVIVARNTATFFSSIYVAKIGMPALASVALVSSFFNVGTLFCFGFISTMNILVSERIGLGKIEHIFNILIQGMLIATLLAGIFIFLLKFYHYFFLQVIPIDLNISLINDYCDSLILGVLPLFWHITLQQYLMGYQKILLITVITIASLPLQVFLSYSLAFGEFGMPMLGIYGVGMAFSITSWVIFLSLALVAGLHSYPYSCKAFSWKINLNLISNIIYIGWPIGIMYIIEAIALFCFAGLMASFGKEVLAAYHIVTQFLNMTIIFSLGIAQAATVLIGRSYGARSFHSFHQVSYIALIMGSLVMLPILIGYVFFPEKILSIFQLNATYDINLIQLICSMFSVLVIYQLFDSFRIILLGVLRGIQATWWPMYVVGISFFGIGLPTGYFFAKYFNQSPIMVLMCLIITAIFSAFLLFRCLNKIIQKSSAAFS